MTYTEHRLWAHPHYAAVVLAITQYGEYGRSSDNTGPYINGDSYVRTGQITSPFWKTDGFHELKVHVMNHMIDADPDWVCSYLEREW